MCESICATIAEPSGKVVVVDHRFSPGNSTRTSGCRSVVGLWPTLCDCSRHTGNCASRHNWNGRNILFGESFRSPALLPFTGQEDCLRAREMPSGVSKVLGQYHHRSLRCPGVDGCREDMCESICATIAEPSGKVVVVDRRFPPGNVTYVMRRNHTLGRGGTS
jgi:hypothetical protein